MNSHVPKKKGCGIEVHVDGDYKQVCGEPWAGEVWYCNNCRQRAKGQRIVDLPSTTVAAPEEPLCTGGPFKVPELAAWVDRAVDAETAKDIIMGVMQPRTAVEILRSAANLLEERGKQYDSPGGERSMGKAVAAFNAITGRQLTTEEGWLLMGLVKDVRQYTSGKRHEDSAIDGVAYAALEAEEILEQLAKK